VWSGLSGFAVCWYGQFAVGQLPVGLSVPPASVLAGELCAVLDAGAPGLIVDLPSDGMCDSASLEALMRTARRARAWGSWLRLVVRDPGVRKMVRLVALDQVMPVHASVTEAVEAAALEAAMVAAGVPLTISVSARDGYTLVSLDGEGDVTVRKRLHAALAAQVTARTPHLVVDLSGLSFIDASCLQVLRQASRMADLAGGTLRLVAPQPLVARVMELLGPWPGNRGYLAVPG
jgi:anti-anti-sigma factor